MQLPIVIGLRRSRILACLLWMAWGLVALVAALSPIAMFSKLLIGLASCWMAFAARKRLQPLVREIRLECDGQISVSLNDGAFYVVRCLPRAVVHPWLTVLRLETKDGGRYMVLFTVDTLAPDIFRRLRVFLRWKASFNECVDGV